MKTKIDKGEVMRKAWKIFRGDSDWSWSFSDSLRRAWEIVKENAASAARAIREAAEMEKIRSISARPVVNGSVVFHAAEAALLTDWYANAPRGTYFGD